MYTTTYSSQAKAHERMCVCHKRLLCWACRRGYRPGLPFCNCCCVLAQSPVYGHVNLARWVATRPRAPSVPYSQRITPSQWARQYVQNTRLHLLFTPYCEARLCIDSSGQMTPSHGRLWLHVGDDAVVPVNSSRTGCQKICPKRSICRNPVTSGITERVAKQCRDLTLVQSDI